MRINALGCRKHAAEQLLLLGVFASIFSPVILKFGEIGLRIDDFVFFLFLPAVYLLLSKKIIIDRYVRIFLFLIFSISLSTLYGYAFLSVPFNQGDINEIVRMLKPLMIFLCVYQLDQEYLKKKIISLLFIGSFVVIGISFMEYFSDCFAAAMGSLYSSEPQTEGMLSVFHRVIVTGVNPNDGAAILLYFFSFNITKYILSKKWIYFILSMLLVISIFMTSSRTALVAVAAIIGYFLMRGRGGGRKVFLALSVLGIVLFCWNQFRYISSGFNLFMRNEDISWITRQNNFREAMELFEQSPILGWGIAKSIHTTIVDGEYFFLIRKFGLIGLSLVLLFISYVPGRYLFASKKLLDDEELILGDLLINYFMASLIIMISNNFFSGYQLILMYVMISSIVLRSLNSLRMQADS